MKNTHLGILVTDEHRGFAFARVCSVGKPASALRLVRSWCPVPSRFEMLVRAPEAPAVYHQLRRFLKEQPAVHALEAWSPWFVYNDAFADAVTTWCQDAQARGLIEPDEELAKKWVGDDRPLPVRTFETRWGVRRRNKPKVEPANQ